MDKIASEHEKVVATLEHLRALQWFKAACVLQGEPHRASFTNDVSWLVNQAINRRANWPEDPSTTRGSAMPVNGKYPKKASGDSYNHLRLIARELNTPRLIVREQRLGEWKQLIMSRIPERITTVGDEAY